MSLPAANFIASYPAHEPALADIRSTTGWLLLEFGAPWCGICRAAQPALAEVLGAHPDMAHVKVADGSGLPLGRAFGVKLWPTLVLLRDGVEVGRAVRPAGREAIATLLTQAA